MIDTLTFNGIEYPKFQSIGNAARFAIPYAQMVCSGRGVDIGCMKSEWTFPNAIPIDPILDERYHALSFPHDELDYIFSSHCLEHIPDWVSAMDYWYTKLKIGGVLFLYLPDYSQEYWRPWNNRKHLNIFTPTIMKDYMKHKGYSKIFASQPDLNNAFMVMGEKSTIV